MTNRANIVLQGSSLRDTTSEIAIRHSCSSCGSPILMEYKCKPDVTWIAMGTVDEQSVVGLLPEPCEHIFLKSKASWWKIPGDDKLPKYQKFPGSLQSSWNQWIAE